MFTVRNLVRYLTIFFIICCALGISILASSQDYMVAINADFAVRFAAGILAAILVHITWEVTRHR